MVNRPFADGDWIFFKAYTGKAVVIAYDTERGKVYAENGYVFNQDDISYIRTPRKGSKEARDIVAMLALMWRDVKNRHGLIATKIVVENQYLKAKSMLK